MKYKRDMDDESGDLAGFVVPDDEPVRGKKKRGK